MSDLADSFTAAPVHVSNFNPVDYLPQQVSSFFGAGSTNNAPIQPKAAANQSALVSKYAAMRDQINGLPQPIRDAFINIDAQRVAQGSAPITKPQTQAVIKTIQTGKSAAEPKRGHAPWDLPGNALQDLKAIVGSVPRLFDPRTWINEIKALPHIPEEYAKARDAGADPLQAIASAPGVRLIPGSFLAGNIAHPTELLEHPLFATLDALPVAGKLAEGTGVVRAATAAAEEGAKVRPLGTLLTRTLDESGAVVPNAVGRGLEGLRGSRLGQAATEAFGNRDVFREAQKQNERIIGIQNGTIEAKTPVEQLTRRAIEVEEKYQIPEPRRVELTREAELGERGKWSADELAYMHEKREISDGFARVNESNGDLGRILNPATGTYEFYPKDQADRITRDRATRHLQADSTRQIANLREEYLRPTGTIDAAGFRDHIDQATGYGVAKPTNTAVRSIVHALDANGYDVAPLKSAIHKFEKNHTPWSDFGAVYDSWDSVSGPTALGGGATGSAAPRLGAVDIIDELKKHGSHTQAQVLAAAIADKNTARITKALDNLLSQKNSRLPALNDPEFVQSVRSLRERYRFENRAGLKYTEKLAAKYEAKALDGDALTMPAPDRFQTLIEHHTVKTVAERHTPLPTTPEMAAEFELALREKRWGSLPEPIKDIYAGTEREVRDNWQALAEAGADPQFIHRVSRSRAAAIEAPRIGPVLVSNSQVKARLTDFSPGIDDVAVSVSHQGMELLQRQGAESFIDYVMQRSGKSEAELIEQYASQARNPTTSANFEQQLQDRIGKEWERFNPAEEGFNFPSAKLDKYSQDVQWIPKALAKQIRDMNKPVGSAMAAFNTGSRTFRMSVVGLSPRTHLYNILGGAVMTMGETGPGVFRYWKRARAMIKDTSLIENETVRATIGSAKKFMFDSDLSRSEAESSFRFGKTLKRLSDENSVLGKVAGKSMDLNGMFDDQYRVMSYLYGYDKAVTKGLSEATARRAGEELMTKTMMDWAGSTPMERNVFKSVFPFYGFMRHAIKYVSRYPVDHPLRAAVLGAFGKAEEDDLGLLPLSFLGSVPLPFAGDGGNRRLSLNALNPFADAANMFTVAGFLGSGNPVLNTALDAVGVDRGSAELYPTLRFNPDNGRMEAVHENPLMAFLHNTIPQSQIITSLAGINPDFNSMAGNDPAAAARSLFSNAGLPTLFRQNNLAAETIKSELARQKSYTAVKNEAFGSGDYSDAQRYPQFKSDLDAYLALPQSERDGMYPAKREDLFQSVAAILSGLGGSANATAAGGI